MRNKTVAFVLASLAVAGLWFFVQNIRIEGLEAVRLVPRSLWSQPWRPASDVELPPRNTHTVRLATFNIQVFGAAKLAKPHVVDYLARIVRQYDVVAIQEIRSREQDLLPRFLERVNAGGGHYDYVIGPRVGRTDSTEQFAFVFDRTTIEVDRQRAYTVDDPEDLLHREPFVAQFRVRGPPLEQAFTFTLVNVHVDPDEVEAELTVMADLLRAVRDDGEQEDDVLLVGDFNASAEAIRRLVRLPGLASAGPERPTNTRGTHQYDHLLLHQPSTVEFTGRSGVFDYFREFNLTAEEALEISDHLPVWAEFLVIEGHVAGRVARLEGASADPTSGSTER